MDSSPPTSPDVTPEALTHEVQLFVERQERRRRLAPRAALVGLFAGLVAVAFRRTLEAAELLRTRLLHEAHALGPAGVVVAAAVLGVAAALALRLVVSAAPETSGSGIPHLKAVLHRLRPLRGARVLLVKFASGALGIGAGLALGREGPTVQMGGAMGQIASRWIAGNVRERQVLIAAGAGAGLAAAFNAPLAGVLFVLEELQGDFAPGILTASFLASLVADLVTRLLLGQRPVFEIAAAGAPPLGDLPFFVVLGLAAGLLGVAFNRSLLSSLRGFERLGALTRGRAQGWTAGAVGVLIAVCGWYLPDALGGGARLLDATFAGTLSLVALVGLLGLRFAMTALSYGCGTAGGIFAPLLVLGAQLGGVVAIVGRAHFGAASDPAAFAAVGMAALFTAVVRAPLTGTVLLLEMTADYAFMLPILAAAFTAYGVANFLGDQPIYEALLERDARRSQHDAELENTLELELTVRPGSRLDGIRIGDLALPAGCLLVTVRRGVRVIVPHRDTVLTAGDRVRALVTPEAAAGAVMLREANQS